MTAGRHAGRVWAALWIVYLVWGSTYLGIKFAVDTLPPFPMLAIRFLLAGGLLFAWCSRRGLPRPTRRQWLDAAVVGTCLAAIGNGGVGFAETRIDSGLAALIVAVIPLWIALLGRIFLTERLSLRAAAGIGIGLVGVAVLVDPAGASASDLVAIAVVLGGSFAWAAGSVYATTTTPTSDPLLGVSLQMLCGGVVLAAMGAGEWPQVDPGAVTAKSLLAVVYLVLVGSVLAYSAYAYVNPVVAVMLGTLFAGEKLTVPTLAGGAVIVVAVVLIVTARPRPAPAAEPALEPAREAA